MQETKGCLLHIKIGIELFDKNDLAYSREIYISSISSTCPI